MNELFFLVRAFYSDENFGGSLIEDIYGLNARFGAVPWIQKARESIYRIYL